MGGLGFSTSAQQNSFRPSTVEHHPRQAINIGLMAIRAKIDRLENALSKLLPEALIDPAMATEVALLKQMIGRLKEYV